MEKKWAIGIDLGGTKVEIARVDESGQLLDHHKINISNKKVSFIEELIISEVRQIISKEGNPLGVGIGVAGQIDSQTGTVIFAPNLQWENHPLKDHLSKALKIPIFIINDVRAATLAEWSYGSGKNCSDLICLFIGTGIGGGIVSGGHMLFGCSNTAGEVGHMTIDLYGPLCTCGNRGCFEALGSGWAMAQRAKELLTLHPNTKILQLANGKEEDITAKIVIEAGREGDSLANTIIENAKKALIAGSISLVNAFNPCRLIIGGGIVEGLPDLAALIDEGVKRSALKAATRKLEVLTAKLQNQAGVIGASTLAIRAGKI